MAHFRSALQATSAVQCRLARGKAPSFQRHLAPHCVALVAIIGTTDHEARMARKSLTVAVPGHSHPGVAPPLRTMASCSRAEK